jgi:hypothetical protein
MSSYAQEKDFGSAHRKEKHSEDLERTQTVYDDNFHGLNVKTITVYLVCTSLINVLSIHN